MDVAPNKYGQTVKTSGVGVIKDESYFGLLRSVRKVGAWGKGAFNTHLTENQLMGHGICKSPFIRNGSSGTVATTVCFLERNREKLSPTVPDRSNIMENGLFDMPIVSSDVLFVCFQESIAVDLSALSLAIQFQGLLSFFILLNSKLPLTPNRRSYYEYIYWFVAHLRNPCNELLVLECCFPHSRSQIIHLLLQPALIGFSLILAILRAFDVRDEASRVMVAAPLVAFLSTHILYPNFYKLDYAQLVILGIWAGVATSHPSRWKVWLFAALS
ncbi:hypothetical protein PTKIN_Ptkin05aG0150800 [Pterospermum kingtungense]